MCCLLLFSGPSFSQAKKHDLGTVIGYGVHGSIAGEVNPRFSLLGEYSFGIYYRFPGEGAFDLLGSVQWGTSVFRTPFEEGVSLLQKVDHLRLFALAELKIGTRHRLLAGIVPRYNFNLQGSVESEDGGFFKRASYRAGLTASEYTPDMRAWHIAPLVGYSFGFSKAVSVRLYAEPDLFPMLRSNVDLGGNKNVFTFPTPSPFHPTLWRLFFAMQFRIGQK